MNQWRSAFVLLTLTTTQLTAQSWNSIGPTVPFYGKLATVTGGMLCYDDATSTTNVFAGGWSTVTTANAPSPRNLSTLSAARSAGNNFAYLFGGYDPSSATVFLNDLWRFDVAAGNWQPIPLPLSPSPRIGAGMAPITIGQLLFGGQDLALGVRNDCWLYFAGLGWFQQPVPAGMAGRVYPAMCQGPGNTVVLFGGLDASSNYLGDTWIWSNNVWSPLNSPVPGPSARMTQIVYDPLRDMVVLHGGSAAVGTLNDDWEFNGFDWRQVGASPTQLDAFAFSAASLTTTAGVFGITTVVTTDTLRFTPSPAWFDSTIGTFCNAGAGNIVLSSVNRSLPILNATFAMRVTGLTATSLLLGGFELQSAGGPVGLPLTVCPQCIQGLTFGPSTVTQFVSGGAGPGAGSWNLPIANVPALLGQGLEFQAIVVDAGTAHPCFLMTSNHCSGIVGL